MEYDTGFRIYHRLAAKMEEPQRDLLAWMIRVTTTLLDALLQADGAPPLLLPMNRLSVIIGDQGDVSGIEEHLEAVNLE